MRICNIMTQVSRIKHNTIGVLGTERLGQFFQIRLYYVRQRTVFVKRIKAEFCYSFLKISGHLRERNISETLHIHIMLTSLCTILRTPYVRTRRTVHQRIFMHIEKRLHGFGQLIDGQLRDSSMHQKTPCRGYQYNTNKDKGKKKVVFITHYLSK